MELGSPALVPTPPQSESLVDPERDPWVIARNRFLQDSTPEEKLLFNSATVETLYYGTSNTEREDRKSSKMRNVARKIQPLVDVIQEFGAAMDVYSNAYPLVLAPLWGSIRVLLVLGQSFKGFFDMIVHTLEEIGEALPRFSDYQKIFPPAQHDRLREALEQNLKGMKRLLQPLSPRLSKNFGSYADRFKQHEKNVRKAADLCHMIEESKERESARESAQASRELEKKQFEEERRKKLLRLLSPVSAEQKHESIRRSRHPESCNWIFTMPEYKAWNSLEGSALICCYGIPGCGKTILSSSVIDSLKSSQHEDADLTYYYCDYADRVSLDPRIVLGTLALGLLRYYESNIPSVIMDQIALSFRDGDRIPETDDVLQILLQIIDWCGNVILVIDGIDEVKEADFYYILGFLKSLVTRPGVSVKFFLTCREDKDVLSIVSPATGSCFRLHLSDSVISPDISSYIRQSVGERMSIGRLAIDPTNLELRDDVIQALSTGAKGMFLWVRFQLEDLCLAESEDGIRLTLQNLPKDLDETYHRLLRRITLSERQILIRRMFKWIIAARRPLSPEELCEGMAFTIEDQRWDAKQIPTNLLRIIRACGNLVVVDESTNRVRLAHYTVQQYLLRERPESDYQFNMQDANDYLGEVCIAYLCFKDFETQVTKYFDNGINASMKTFEALASPTSPTRSPFDPVARLSRFRQLKDIDSLKIDYSRYLSKAPQSPASVEKFSLLIYARRNWLWHSATSTVHTPPTKRDILFRSLITQKELPFEFKPWPADVFLGSPYPDLAGWAIVNNNPALIKSLEEFDSRFKFVDCIQDSVIWFEELVVDHSISQEHLDAIAECDRGIWTEEIPVRGWMYSKMLSACRKGNLAILDLCRYSLERDESHWSHFREHLMFEAAGANQIAVFHSFLVSPRVMFPQFLRAEYGGHLCNALERAALMGHSEIVRDLSRAEWIADNIFGNDPSPGVTALSNAILGGNPDVVDALLQAFDITNRAFNPRNHNARPGIKADGFCKAVTTGNMVVVDAFLANGASPLVPNDAGMCPYMQAIKAGHMGVVLSLFFMRGCSIEENATGLPLTMAAANGHSEIIDLLISKGAPADVYPRYFQRYQDTGIGTCPTPLYAASANGHCAVVNQLLAAGAGVNVVSPRDLLMVSEGAGSEQCSSLYTFANKPASTSNVIVGLWQSPLGGAAINGHLEIVQTLLVAKNHVISPDPQADDPLLLAAIGGHCEVVRRLRYAGAKIHPTSIASQNMLASSTGLLGAYTLQVLLEEGISPDSTGEQGETCLHRAAASGKISIMRQLIDAGGSVDAQDSIGRTPLMRACASKHLKAVSVLVAAKSDLTIKDQEALSGSSWASDHNHEMLPQQVDHGARGRRFSREPQYDSVPIPGGYSLVRGQGASTAPTEYDPRGLNRAQQVDPRLGHSQTWAPG